VYEWTSDTDWLFHNCSTRGENLPFCTYVRKHTQFLKRRGIRKRKGLVYVHNTSLDLAVRKFCTLYTIFVSVKRRTQKNTILREDVFLLGYDATSLDERLTRDVASYLSATTP